MPTQVEYDELLLMGILSIESGQPVPRSYVQETLQYFAGTGAPLTDLQHIPLPSAQSPVWESIPWETKHILPELEAAVAAVNGSPSVIVGITHDHPI
jgi:hypothetical protein